MAEGEGILLEKDDDSRLPWEQLLAGVKNESKDNFEEEEMMNLTEIRKQFGLIPYERKKRRAGPTPIQTGPEIDENTTQLWQAFELSGERQIREQKRRRAQKERGEWKMIEIHFYLCQ
ncbi:hypothetical protein QYF36_021938 [Acer negundo]|nr:hypothetical protein QYF36_021938 [Acer negundo]